jgi:hypothetical protein
MKDFPIVLIGDPDHKAVQALAVKRLTRQTAETKPTFGAESEGCWFDGARGIYIGDAIIKKAIQYGWACDVLGTGAPSWQVSPTWTEYEFYHELTDEAEEFMNGLAAEGYWFGFSEQGDWGLWASEEA